MQKSHAQKSLSQKSMPQKTMSPKSMPQQSKYDAGRYLKSAPKTDFYLVFALFALFMTMVLM